MAPYFRIPILGCVKGAFVKVPKNTHPSWRIWIFKSVMKENLLDKNLADTSY